MSVIKKIFTIIIASIIAVIGVERIQTVDASPIMPLGCGLPLASPCVSPCMGVVQIPVPILPTFPLLTKGNFFSF